MEEEIWKDIPEYEGLYQVSNLGRVKTLDKYVNSSYGSKQLRKSQILKPIKINKDGYMKVNLYKDNKPKSFLVHRLVAKCFLEAIEGKDIVNHKDQNPSNNHVDNLEFCTVQYNNTYNNAHIKRGEKYKGKNNWNYGKHHTEETKQKISIANKGKGSKPILQYSLIGEFIREWDSVTQASQELKINRGNITKCCKGKIKTCGDYVWRFK